MQADGHWRMTGYSIYDGRTFVMGLQCYTLLFTLPHRCAHAT